ncbi:putative B3 domain-containing protein [Cocos nucifera]|nr:putative B3 domain-containing protein [Cocos nucifera]
MQEARMMESKGKKVDEIHRPRMIPRWVMELAEQEKGTDPCFIMAKKLTESDLNPWQNRLIMPAGFVNAHLIPFLSDEEKAAASLLDDDGRKRKKPSSKAEGSKKVKLSDGGVEATEEKEKIKKKKEVGRMHGGLRVPVYVGANKWKAFVVLTRWDSSNCTVLKGGEYSRYLARWSGVKKGEEVELWGFREGESGRPCLVLHRKGDAEGN